MLVIKEKANIKISYPIENIADKDKVLFFDIETTGFSRKYCNVYLIGCLYFCGNQPMYAQWMADNFNDEANVLMAFHKFIQSYNTLIHFNGNSFDIPFLHERGQKYNLDFDFDRFVSIDIYKSVSGINHILKMQNQKQKTFEQMIGLTRVDPFTGGDLVEVFRQYVESKDGRLIYPMLLHNKEDVWNMGLLLPLLSLSDLFNGSFRVVNYMMHDFKNINNDTELELCISLSLDNPIPFSLSYNFSEIYFQGEGLSANISVKMKNGTYKYFFHNYNDYYYLPLEDKAIHKSVAGFVDRKYRKKATSATCYEKFSGSFLPIFNSDKESFTQIFKENYNDKNGFIKSDFLNSNNIYEYSCIILDFLKQKPKPNK